MQYPNFLSPSYQSESTMAGNQRLVNYFLERNESFGSPMPWCALPTPGFSAFASVSQAPIRAFFEENGRAFFVAGYVLYEVTSAGVTTNRATLAADTNPATICSNGFGGNQLFITSGAAAYSYNLNTNVVTTVLGSISATMGAFLDGYFLAFDTTTSMLYVSKFEDGTTWDVTQKAQRTAGSDPLKAMVVINRLIYLLGEHTSEVWWNTGASPFPFTPIQEAFMTQGIVGIFAYATNGSQLGWLSQSAQGAGMMVHANGYAPQRISTHAIEHLIQDYTKITDAVGFGYQQQGHTFLGWIFPTANQTWVHDVTDGVWHERLYWNTTKAVWQAYRAAFFISAFGSLLCGDRLTGNIYTVSNSSSTAIWTDVDGSAIRRLIQPPRLAINQKRFTVNRLQPLFDVGVGLATGQGRAPTAMLEISRDAGKTFGNEIWTSGGAMGQYQTRVQWRQLGQARNFVPRLTVSDPIPWRLTDCEVDLSVGLN